MKVRVKGNPTATGISMGFNMHAMFEVIVGFDGDGGVDSMFGRDLEVQLPSGEWKDLPQAFTDKDVVPNNHNTDFAPPMNDECKARGYNP